MTWNPNMDEAPRDGTWFIASWDGKSIPARYLDNSDAKHGPWEGFVVPSLWPRPRAAEPQAWQPFPAPLPAPPQIKD